MMKRSFVYIVGLSLIGFNLNSCGSTSTDSEDAKSKEEVVNEIEHTELSLSPEDKTAFEAKAMQVVKTSFKTLSKNVKMAMAEGGVQHAVEFCNGKAMPLTDSLSTAFGVQIKRLTDKTRNSENAMSPFDKDIWADFLHQKQTSDTILPTTLLSENGSEVITYVPIQLDKPLCLACHGVVGTNVSESDYEFIHNLYPDDQATGYALGDLRGMWKVTQTKN